MKDSPRPIALQQVSKLRSVQVLRGVAATAVVACHMTDFPMGAVGVDLFFVISGFIIGKVMVGRSTTEFLRDRLWRIFPFYWLCALPWLLFAWNAGQIDAPRTLASLTLWPIYDEFAKPYLRVAWSLCYEMLFYLAATASLATGKGKWLVAVFLACFALNLAAPSPLVGFLGYPLIFNFLFGLAITRLRLDERAGIAALVAGLAIIPLAPAALFAGNSIGVSDWSIAMRVLWWGVPSALIVYGALSLERFASWRTAILIGDASYSIYLTHLLVWTFIQGLTAIPIAVAFGVAVHLWVEKPLLGLRRSRGFPLPAPLRSTPQPPAH